MSKKAAKTIVSANLGKQPKCNVEQYEFFTRHPAWRFSGSRRYNASEYGWDAMKNNMGYIVEHLHDLEMQTWNDIYRDRKKHHGIPVSDLSNEAQKLLVGANEDVDEVFSVHISSRERLFGIIEPGVGILNVIWWDPEHRICPCPKKHT